jgi:hypothetical protein
VDVQTIDSQYDQLQRQTQGTVQAIQSLAGKLQPVADSGDNSAKELLLDLRAIALQVQQEQLQVQSLLQAIHAYALNVTQPAQALPSSPQPVYVQQPAMPAQQAGGGMHRFFGGNFGQAIEQGAGMGVGFGITNSIIDSIFGR